MKRKHQLYHQTQGTTGETASSNEKMDVGTQTGLNEEEKDAQYKKDYADGIFELLEEIRSMLVCLVCPEEEEKDAQDKKDYPEGVFEVLEEIRSMFSMFRSSFTKLGQVVCILVCVICVL